MNPGSYTVEVVIENKPLARDPEGETIHHNLILKGGYSQVTNVRAGKLLRMSVQSGSAGPANRIPPLHLGVAARLRSDLPVRRPGQARADRRPGMTAPRAVANGRPRVPEPGDSER